MVLWAREEEVIADMRMSRLLIVALVAVFISAVVEVVPAEAGTECVRLSKPEGEWKEFENAANCKGIDTTKKSNYELFDIFAAEWLANGAPVTAELGTETSGELELTDTKTLVGEVTVLCSEVMAGWVGPSSLDHASEVLNLGKEAVSNTALSGTALTCTAQKGCETGTAPTLYPLHMPWDSEVELYEGTAIKGPFFIDLLFGSGGSPGWELTCLVVGTSVTDECTFVKEGEAASELTLEGSTLLANFSKEITELSGAKLGTCSQGGAESAVVAGGGPYALTGGGELTASLESAVS